MDMRGGSAFQSGVGGRGYGETLRRRREFPDLDGTLTAASVPLPGGKAYLTLQAVYPVLATGVPCRRARNAR